VLGTDDLLNLPIFIGQVGSSFRFDLVDGASGMHLGTVTPLADSPPTLEHDTSATISRRVQSFTLGVADSAAINPLTDRVAITMILGDTGRTEFPLGRYMFADKTGARFSQGTITAATLFDEMFIVDQDMEQGFNALGQSVDVAIRRLLDGLPIGEIYIDSTSQSSTNSWGSGSSRGSALTELATVGGLFKPWFNHLNQLRAIRAFEPGGQIADIDLDDPPRVYAGSIAESDDLLSAPNRYVVVSNNIGGSYSTDGEEEAAPPPVVGVYDVPSSAPHSIAQRGFVLSQVLEAQVTTHTAAGIYARTLGRQRDVYQRVELSTPPDPRHDGYQVIRWDGRLWLETGWTLPLTPGGDMRHKLRRAFPPSSEDVLL
jgi:hypothetical protein